jgi:hypothetical protein
MLNNLDDIIEAGIKAGKESADANRAARTDDEKEATDTADRQYAVFNDAWDAAHDIRVGLDKMQLRPKSRFGWNCINDSGRVYISTNYTYTDKDTAHKTIHTTKAVITVESDGKVSAYLGNRVEDQIHGNAKDPEIAKAIILKLYRLERLMVRFP